MSLQPGDELVHYTILEPIGKGGMGEVYRAKDSKLGRDVAIKVLPDEFARDEERLARFKREAKVLASLNHPNIASIYGLERSGSTHFLVLELVDGETLDERIAKGPIPVDDAVSLFVQIAAGLEAAHDKGIVHRDLKPANIMIGADGKVKILDFGLAKAFASDEGGSAETSESPTVTKGTALGAIMGTASYMSPEQARGKAVDTRSDIWAFGCCLYEALSGKKTFDGATVTDILAAVIKNDPDWESVPTQTPSGLRRLLRRCLEKDAHGRLHHIADARIELAEPEEFGSVAGDRVVRRAPVVPALLAAILAGLAVLLFTRTDRRDLQLTTYSAIPLPSGAELRSSSSRTPYIAISPDGRHVAFVAHRGDGLNQLYLRALNRADATLIEDTDDARMPFFSPDSQWLGFQAGDKLKKISVSGGAAVDIADVTGNIRGASWGARDQIIVAPGREAGLARVSASGGALEVLTEPKREEREKSHRNPDILPGGEAVLFHVATSDLVSFDDARIEVLLLETGERRVLIEGGMNARYVTTGHILYTRAGTVLAVPFDVDTLEIRGAPTPVLPETVTAPIFGSAEFSVSTDGTLLYARGPEQGIGRRLGWVDRAGTVEPLPMEERAFYWGMLSPDGGAIVLGIQGAIDAIWTYDIRRQTLTSFASGWENFVPIWTPDGNRFTFGSNREGPSNIFWQLADGSGSAERLLSSKNTQYPHSWSPDGRALAYYEESPETGDDLWIVNPLDNEDPRVFLETEFNERFPSFAPNGRWIVYESDESGRLEVYVRSFPEAAAKQQISTGGGEFPVWSRDGDEIFYLDGDKMMAVDVLPDDMRLGKPRLLFEIDDARRTYDVAKDGRFLMTIDPRLSITHLQLVHNWFQELERLVPTDN